MVDHVVFALSAFLAQVLTNLDNLAALIALMLVSGPVRSVLGFLLAQIIIIGASVAVALGVDDIVPQWAGYLGLIPLSLGIVGAIRRFRDKDGGVTARISSSTSILVTTLIFISLSMDTFAVLAPLLADSAPSFRLAGAVGASLAALALATLALLSTRTPFMTGRVARRLEGLVPYVMIGAGLYILSNTWTDAI